MNLAITRKGVFRTGKKHFAEEQRAVALRQAESGTSAAEIIRWLRGSDSGWLTPFDNQRSGGLAIEVGQRLAGDVVVSVLEQVTADPGKPRGIRVDNWSEFISRSLDLGACFNGVKLHFNRPGTPTDHAVIEAFSGRLREGCLHQLWFLSLDEAKRLTEARRKDYKRARPRASSGQRTPFVYARRVDGHSHLPALSG